MAVPDGIAVATVRQRSSSHGRRRESDIVGSAATGLGLGFTQRSLPSRTQIDWSVSVDSQSTAPFSSGEPPAHYRGCVELLQSARGTARSRDQALTRGFEYEGRPWHAGDAPMFAILMDQLRVQRRSPGRPRTARTGYEVTRRTLPERSTSTCVSAASPTSSQSLRISRVTASGEDRAADARSNTMSRTARAAAPSNAASTRKSNLLPATTSEPSPTAAERCSELSPADSRD